MTAHARRNAYLEALGAATRVRAARARRCRTAAAAPARSRSRRTWDAAARARGRRLHALRPGATRTQTVFGVGDRQAAWLIVGEAPGAEEDRQGEPFVGRAGQLLNSMLRAIGLRARTVYIANVLKCRPPGNRDPRAGEVAECLPYLQGQIALLQPKIMLAVGRIAAQNLLRTDDAARRACATGCTPSARARVPLVVTYHPAYLLRTPARQAQGVGGSEIRPRGVRAVSSVKQEREPWPEEAQIRPMHELDVPVVVAIERAAYQFPWSEGIFRDCLRVGYVCRVIDVGGEHRPATASCRSAPARRTSSMSASATSHRCRGLGRASCSFICSTARALRA